MTDCLSTASENGRAFRCESSIKGIKIVFVLPVLVVIRPGLIPMPQTVSERYLMAFLPSSVECFLLTFFEHVVKCCNEYSSVINLCCLADILINVPSMGTSLGYIRSSCRSFTNMNINAWFSVIFQLTVFGEIN